MHILVSMLVSTSGRESPSDYILTSMEAVSRARACSLKSLGFTLAYLLHNLQIFEKPINCEMTANAHVYRHLELYMTEQDASSGADDQSSTLSKELLCASEDGDLHKVKHLVEVQQVDLHSCRNEQYRNTPLHLASE